MGTNIERPNLLYIHSDQHNPAVIGCYGDPLVQTPNLDSLAAQGTFFTNVYCPVTCMCAITDVDVGGTVSV